MNKRVLSRSKKIVDGNFNIDKTQYRMWGWKRGESEKCYNILNGYMLKCCYTNTYIYIGECKRPYQGGLTVVENEAGNKGRL